MFWSTVNTHPIFLRLKSAHFKAKKEWFKAFLTKPVPLFYQYISTNKVAWDGASFSVQCKDNEVCTDKFCTDSESDNETLVYFSLEN